MRADAYSPWREYPSPPSSWQLPLLLLHHQAGSCMPLPFPCDFSFLTPSYQSSVNEKNNNPRRKVRTCDPIATPYTVQRFFAHSNFIQGIALLRPQLLLSSLYETRLRHHYCHLTFARHDRHVLPRSRISHSLKSIIHKAHCAFCIFLSYYG